MAKFPQSVITGHIDVSIDANQRASATDAGGIKLSKNEWAEVESICEEYINSLRHEQAHPDAADVSKLVQKINNSAKQLQRAIEDVTEQPDDQARDVACSQINAHLGVMGSLSNLLGPLHDLTAASSAALEIVADQTADAKPGPAKSRALEQFILMMARLFKRVGGHPTSYWNEHKGERGGPFTDFMWIICECLPSEFRPTSKTALAEQVRRLNNRSKKIRGKTISEIVDLAPFTGGR